MVTTIYQITATGTVGQTAQIADDAGAPAGWTRAVPPVPGVGNEVIWGHDGWEVRAIPAPLPKTAEDYCADVDFIRNSRLAAGYLHSSGKRVDVSDTSINKILSINSAADRAKAGVTTWADPWDAWIAMDNTLVSLPTPDDGITFALDVGTWVGKTIRYAADLKSQVRAAADPSSVDIATGWPG